MIGGIAAGVAAALAIGGLALLFDLVDDDLDPSALPLTGFVFDPGLLSFVIALLAGAVGMLSLTEGRSGALGGVFISVTTIPAIAGIGIALAAGHVSDALSAALQLGINLAGLVLACVLTLWIQWRTWRRISRP